MLTHMRVRGALLPIGLFALLVVAGCSPAPEQASNSAATPGAGAAAPAGSANVPAEAQQAAQGASQQAQQINQQAMAAAAAMKAAREKTGGK